MLINLLKFDWSQLLNSSTLVAIIAIIAPTLVAIINNAHHTKIRKLEIEQDIKIKVSSVYYEDKKKAFNDFVVAAGNYKIGLHPSVKTEALMKIDSTANNVILFCNEQNKKLVFEFIEYSHSIYEQLGSELMLKYRKMLFELTNALNNELSDIREQTCNTQIKKTK